MRTAILQAAEAWCCSPRDAVSALPLRRAVEGVLGSVPQAAESDLSFTVLFQEKDLISKELGVQAAGVRSFHL